MDAVATWLEGQPAQAWAAICATSRVARSSQGCRLALAARTPQEALALLRAGEGQHGTAPARELRLAWQLIADSTEEQAEVALQQWQALGVVPTALVGQPPVALLGVPPRWRLIDPDQAELQLVQHGYGFCLLLQPPSLEQIAPQLQQQVMFDTFGSAVAALKEGVEVSIPDPAMAAAVKEQTEDQASQPQ